MPKEKSKALAPPRRISKPDRRVSTSTRSVDPKMHEVFGLLMAGLQKDRIVNTCFNRSTTFNLTFSGAQLSVNIPKSIKRPKAVKMKTSAGEMRRMMELASKKSSAERVTVTIDSTMFPNASIDATVKTLADQFLSEHGEQLAKLKAQVKGARAGFRWVDPAKAEAPRLNTDEFAQLLGAQRI